jgi:spermidine synthase
MSANKKNWKKLSAAGLGFLALGAQIVIIRSLLEIFQGNELTVGLALAVWLTGTASGSLLFPRIAHHRIWQHLPVVTGFPVIIANYLLIRFLPKILGFLPLVPQNFIKTLLILCLSILPASWLCGALFPYLSRQYSLANGSTRSSPVNTIYIWESSGSLSAALLMNFVLFQLAANLQILFICLLLFYAILFVNTFNHRPIVKLRYLFVFYIIIILLLLPASPQIQQLIHAHTLAPYQVEAEKDTPYGNIKLLELEQQELLLQQGLLVYTLPDPSSAEFRMLPPLLSHPAPRSLLLIGGNLIEYLPYLQRINSLQEIIYLEKDPYLMEFQRDRIKKLKLDQQADITFVNDDIRNYFSREKKLFDVICLNESEPYTLYQNRFYTREFYQLIKKHLAPAGIFYFTLKSSENYINPPLGKYLNLQHNTLKSVFSNLFIIPGDENHFLLSDQPYSFDWQNWSSKMMQYGITPQFLTPVYWQYRLSPQRLDSYEKQLAKWQHSEINHDFNLKGYLYHFRVWGGLADENLLKIFDFLYRFRYQGLILFLIFLIILKIIVSRYSSYRLLFNLAFIGGLSMLAEMIILLWYQINFGNLYSALALIFGLFMLGLAVGAWCSLNGFLRYFSFSQLYLACSVLLMAMLLIIGLPGWQPMVMWRLAFLYKWLLVPLLVFLDGLFAGSFFAHTTREYYHLKPGSSPGITYGVDLIGGVLASVITSILLVPFFGLAGITGIAIGLVLLFWLFERRRFS